jgi:hypothetical protein
MEWIFALIIAFGYIIAGYYGSKNLENIENCEQKAKYIYNIKNEENVKYSSQLEQCFVKIENTWKKVN